jgi:hypothetical protein
MNPKLGEGGRGILRLLPGEQLDKEQANELMQQFARWLHRRPNC